MGKLLGVVLVIIALASAYPILKNQYPLPEDISTHGHLIDEQLHDTMIEAGISFVGAQLVLAFFVWSFTGRKPGSPLKNFPGGARVLVIVAFVIVGLEVLALGAFGQKAWASVYFTPAKADSLQIQAQAEQFAFYFRYAGPDGKFGQIHPEIAASRKLRRDVYVAEFDLEKLYEIGLRTIRYTPIVKYPAVERDFSFVFSDDVPFIEMKKAVWNLGVAEIREFHPVEIFRGGAISPGKYSVLLRAKFQSKDRTLREEELADWSSKIVAALTALDGVQRA